MKMKMKKLAVAVLLVLGMTSTTLYAGDTFVELGTSINAYGSFADIADADTSIGLDARWGGLFGTGLYAWGSYEQPDISFGKLNLGTLRMAGLGGGYRLGNRFYGYVEGGYYLPYEDSALAPFTFSNEFGGSVGVGFDITESITVDAGYRYLEVTMDSHFGAQNVELSAWTVGASYRF